MTYLEKDRHMYRLKHNYKNYRKTKYCNGGNKLICFHETNYPLCEKLTVANIYKLCKVTILSSSKYDIVGLLYFFLNIVKNVWVQFLDLI